MQEEAIEQPVEIIKAGQMGLEDEAIVAGNPMTLDNVRNFAGKVGDLLHFSRHRLDANEHGDFVTERTRIELRLVSTDDAGLFKALHTLADGGRGHADPS